MKRIPVIVIPVLTILIIAVSCVSRPSTPVLPPPVVEEPRQPAPQVTPGPELRMTLSPRNFNPHEGELSIYLSAEDNLRINRWRVEIREPFPPHLLFYEWEGQGAPPEVLTWDGVSLNGELVLSAINYPITFSATNSEGVSSTIESRIPVDVFVTRDGESLRIQVQSIIFAPNVANMIGLSPEILASNDDVIRRVAEILNTFPDYRVLVEGHANPTVRPGAPCSQTEETEELQPLSELRSMVIVDYLINHGIARERLSSVGLGGRRTIVPWTDRDNWWKNRRVEFILIR